MWQDWVRQIVGERIFIWTIQKRFPFIDLSNGGGCALTLCNDELLLESDVKSILEKRTHKLTVEDLRFFQKPI